MEATVPCAYILGRDRSSRDRRPRRTARAGGARVGALAAGLVPASWLPGAGVLGWEPREPGGQQPLLRAGRPPFPRLPGLARGAPAGSADAEGARVPQGPPGTPRPRGRLWAPGARSRSLGRGRRERQERGAGGSGSRKRAAARGRRESARGSRGGRGRGGGKGGGVRPASPAPPRRPLPPPPSLLPEGPGAGPPLPASLPPSLSCAHLIPVLIPHIPGFLLSNSRPGGGQGPSSRLPAPGSPLPAPRSRRPRLRPPSKWRPPRPAPPRRAPPSPPRPAPPLPAAPPAPRPAGSSAACAAARPSRRGLLGPARAPAASLPPPAPRSLPLPLTHSSRNRELPCFPVSPILGKLLPRRAPLRSSRLRSSRLRCARPCPALPGAPAPAAAKRVRVGAGWAPAAARPAPCAAALVPPGAPRTPWSRLSAPARPHPGTGPTGAPPSGALEGKAGTITSNEWSPPNSPEGSNVSGGSQALDKPIDNDAEGVWSPDIEQSFQEALAIYPPCGRRKIILSDEGKMYGRNELIARYIKLRTGKTRTRKQVSSHIQVLARRKAREIQAKLKDQAAKDKALQSMAPMSPAQAISATAFHSKMALARGPGHPAVSGFWQGALPGQAGTSHDVKPFSQQTYTVQPSLPLPGFESPAGPTPSPSAPPAPPWQGRSVASSKLWMLEFSAFLEQQQDPDTYNKHLFVHIGQSSPSYSDPYLEAVDIRQIYDKFPEKKGGLKELFERGPSNAFFLVKFWADLNTNIEDEGSSFYGVSSQYESPENMIITCSTKVCSFGKQVVEKVETEYARYENGHYSYRIHRSPLCEYMINFIHKLKHLPEKYMMNSVLENFTILQVVTNRDTQETLLCIAYVFEVSASEHGAQHHIYRLVKE
uniref:TEA domain-containing protein n=1 Tax=Canis lupus familiaris TaxID=9615 RepID=A0A8C0PQP3_CANLF